MSSHLPVEIRKWGKPPHKYTYKATISFNFKINHLAHIDLKWKVLLCCVWSIYYTRKHSSRIRTDRAVTRMSSEPVAMRPIMNRMTRACGNITFPCGIVKESLESLWYWMIPYVSWGVKLGLDTISSTHMWLWSKVWVSSWPGMTVFKLSQTVYTLRQVFHYTYMNYPNHPNFYSLFHLQDVDTFGIMFGQASLI